MMDLLRGYEARPYHPQLKGEWDHLVSRAKNSNFLFLRDYMDYHSERFDDHSLMFYKDGRLLGCLPGNVTERTLHSHQGLTYGGLLMHPKIRFENVCSIMSLLSDHLQKNAFSSLVYNPMPYIYHRLPADEDLVALSDLRAQIVASKAICVIRNDNNRWLSRNRKRDVDRFLKSGMTIARSYLFESFMKLCESNLIERFAAVPVHAPTVMQSLANKFPGYIKLYAAYNQGTMIAGVVIYCNQGCAKVQYIACTDVGRETGAIAAIYSYILEHILPPNTWLEFGHSLTPAGQFNKGVHNYKESFGARIVQNSTYLLVPNFDGQSIEADREHGPA